VKNKKLLNSIIIGIVLGVLEGVLITFGDPNASTLVLIQSILFWFSVGVIINISDTGLSNYAHSIFIVLFLNIPWYINLTVIPNKLEHLPPMVIVSVLFGLISGFLSKKLTKISYLKD
jgi:hypothetical protein